MTVGEILYKTLAKKPEDVGVLETIGVGGQWCKLYLISELGGVWDESVECGA
jgi:hypothetical protein